jgi:CRP-like cAMP-binding protein
MLITWPAAISGAGYCEAPRRSCPKAEGRALDTTFLVRKLNSIAALTSEEERALGEIPATVKHVPANQDFVHEGDRPSATCLLLDGLAFRYKVADGGRRQIMAFHLPGDIPDLQSLFLKTMDHSLCTLVPSQVALIKHETMLGIIERHPRIGHLLWRDTLIDAAIFREWMVGIGRRPAYTRVAHLLCEFILRMEVIGFSKNHSCELPLSQTVLGDALGLSTVHINRTLQELRRDGLITLQGGTLRAMDWEGLQEAGDFDSSYLHLEFDKGQRTSGREASGATA